MGENKEDGDGNAELLHVRRHVIMAVHAFGFNIVYLHCYFGFYYFIPEWLKIITIGSEAI